MRVHSVGQLIALMSPDEVRVSRGPREPAQESRVISLLVGDGWMERGGKKGERGRRQEQTHLFINQSPLKLRDYGSGGVGDVVCVRWICVFCRSPGK